MHRIFSRFCLLAIFTSMMFAGSASALPYYVRAQASASVSGNAITFDSEDEDTGQVQALSISTQNLFASSTTTFGSASANANGSASLGSLHGYGHFSANVFTNPNLAAAGSAYGQYEQWGDTITFTSSTLPNGTNVQYLATLILDRTISGTTGSNVQVIASGPYGLSITDSLSSPNSTQSVSVVVNTQIGVQQAIASQLYFTASGTAFGGAPRSGTVDVSNTANFTLEPITSGASYSTASGVTYIPEPAMLGLLGMAGILLVSRRRSSPRR